jgi:hypothetical protein
MDVLEFLKEYWILIATVAGLIYTYAVVKLDIKEHARRIGVIEEEIKHLNPIWIEIKERLARIEATLAVLTKEK